MLKHITCCIICLNMFVFFPAFAHFHPDCNTSDDSNPARTALCNYLNQCSETKQAAATNLSMECKSINNTKISDIDYCEIKSDEIYFKCTISATGESCEDGKYMSKEESARTWQYKQSLTQPRDFGITANNGMSEFKNYLLDIHCSDGQGTVKLLGFSGVQIQCTNAKKPGKPDIKSEWKIALCHGYCAKEGKEFKKMENFSMTTPSMCECKKASKKTTQKLKPDNASAAATTPTSTSNAQQDAAKKAEQERKAKEKAAKEADKEKAKQAECAAKNPPQVAKKNVFGKWTCTDSDDTKADREEKKNKDKNLKTFWDDMDELDKEFLERVQELKKQGGKK